MILEGGASFALGNGIGPGFVENEFEVGDDRVDPRDGFFGGAERAEDESFSVDFDLFAGFLRVGEGLAREAPVNQADRLAGGLG